LFSNFLPEARTQRMPQSYTFPASDRPEEDSTIIARKAMGYVRVVAKPIAIWPIVLVIYATLLPREISIHVGENFIYMDRLALLLTMPWVLLNLWRGAIRFVLPDWLVLFTAIWMVISLWVVHGFERALVSGLSFSFDAVSGYYLARVAFRSLADMRRALILCAPAFFVVGLSLAAESLSHHVLVRPFFASIFGGLHYFSGTENIDDVLRVDVRHGLMRAYGPWIHPIEAGLHMSTLLAIYWKSGIRGWPFWLAIAAAWMSIFSVSSSALITLAAITGALFYDWLTTRVRELTWPLLLSGMLVTVLIISVASNSGIVPLLIRFITLDPATGYFRIAIWQYGSLSVAAHPWFGIGFDAYRRPDWMLTSSIDTHWLLYAVRYGLPAAISLFLTCLVAIGGMVRAEKMANRSDAGFYRGIVMSLVALVVMGFTVSFQGGTLTWFTILLGGCVACAQHSYVIDWAFWIRRKPRVAVPLS
jgi:O-antigen ligase